MLHHVEINVSNLGGSRAFWSEILSKLGYKLTAYSDEGFTLSNGEDAYLTFVQVKEKYVSHNYNRSGVGLNHLAFRVKGRSLVDSIRQYCLDNNITCLYDERYPFANGGNDYYALYVEDPDRIKVEFVAT
jgi:catechol 2,3-dioxygenase-like lactoylglutathione lyase family enzyme